MRVVPGREREFEQLCEHYVSADDPAGKDIVTLVQMFAEENDFLRSEDEADFRGAWEVFLGNHKNEVSVVPTLGLILYVLVTYWDMGQLLAVSLPTCERMLIRDTIAEMSREIDRRSAENGDAVYVISE